MKTIVQLVEELKEYLLEKDTAAKQAVESNIAPVEADASSASRTYVVGEQLFLNDVLYDVTSPISVGDAIVVGTNITAANKLSADIKSKIDDLYSKNQTLTNYVNNDIYYDGAKNLLPLLISKIKVINTTGSWSKSDENDVYTISGVTYTITSNANGVITNIKASGTGASSSPFSDLVITLRNTNDAFAMYELIKNNTLTVATHAGNFVNFILDGEYNGSWKTVQAISGKADITLNISTSNNVQTCIRIVAGRTVTNEDITPIMAQKSLMDIDDSFSPYAKTNQQLTEDSVTWDALSEVGAVNYCKNKASSTTTTDGTTTFTWTVNDDKSVTVSAPSYPVTVASNQNLVIWNPVSAEENKVFVNKVWRLTGCPNSDCTIELFRVRTIDGSGGTLRDTGEGLVFTWLNNASGIKVAITLGLNSGTTLTEAITFKPMIAPLSYNGPYVPYAKTNKELTEDGPEISNLTATKNSSFLNGTDAVVFRKYGKMVNCDGYFQVTTAAARNDELYTLSEKPKGDSFLFASTQNGAIVFLKVNTNSKVLVESANGIDTGFYGIVGGFMLA